MDKFKDMDGEVKAITGKEIRALAIRINAYVDNGQMKFSNGWLHRLQQRHGIAQKRKHGESTSVDQDDAEAGRAKIRRITDSFSNPCASHDFSYVSFCTNTNSLKLTITL